MDTDQRIAQAKIAAEDAIADLEKVIARISPAIIRKPARVIHAESPDLFKVNAAITKVCFEAMKAKKLLLETVGMHPRTQLTAVSLGKRR